MKKDIHPKYENTTVECACGNTFETRSTAGPLIKVELCSACHPFFTGKQKFVDTAGRVDKFRARMEAAQAKKVQKEEKTEAPKEAKKDNKETLNEIKENITHPEETPVTPSTEAQDINPIEVTQEQSSDVELAAADEIADDMAEHQKDADNQ